MRLKSLRQCLSLSVAIVMALALMCITAYAADKTVKVLDDQISITDDGGTGTLSDNTVTIQAKGSLFAKATNNITITNETDTKAKLSFDYTASTYNSFTIADAEASATGSYSGILDAGASVTIVLVSNSGWSNTTASLKLSNFDLTAAQDASNVTFVYDESLGSITVGGESVSSGTTKEVSSDGIALTATAKNGTFLGWIDSDGKLLSSSTSYALTPAADMTIQAVFVKKDGSDTAWFVSADGAYMSDDLNAAATYASGASNKTILPAYDGTLSAGNYIIPSGVTLLIPFDDTNTAFTTDHQTTTLDGWIKENAGLVKSGTSAATGPYRTLTMANGANIAVNGTICLSAKLNAPGGGKTNAGAPTGKVPYIVMQGTSNITLNSGAYLYCYGFITGSGSVTVNSGATVYECFQIRDYRGGSGSSSISNSVFPSSQYYVQNVEVPMTVKSGGILKGVSAVTVSLAGVVYMNDISVIGTSGSLFTNSGTVTKSYDGSKDRLIVDIAGDAALGSIALDFGNAGANIDSADYVLGLNNNMTINITSGTTTVNQRLALQPGVVLNINSGAELVLSKNMYVYDADEWGDYVYCESMTEALGGIEHTSTASRQDTNNWAAVQVAFAPGKKYTRTLDDLVDAQINVNGTLTATSANLYTTSSGANITSSEGTGKVVMVAGSDAVTYQADMNSSSDLTYYSIAITSAQLHNGQKANYTYVSTTAATSATTYYYCPDCDMWSTDDDAVAHIINADGYFAGHYGTLQTAVTDYETGAYTGGYVQMCDASTAVCSITGTVYLDLNGHNVSGVTLSGTLKGADSRTDGFVAGIEGHAPGTISLSGTPDMAATVNGKGYVAVAVSGGYQFHRFAITPSACRYYYNDENTHAHLAVQATIQGTDEAMALLSDVGFEITSDISDADGSGWYTEDTDLTLDKTGLETVSFVALDYVNNANADILYAVTAKAKFSNGGSLFETAPTQISLNLAKSLTAAET